MALKKQVSNIPIPDAGTIPARLARIVEIGQHQTQFGVKDQLWMWYSLPTRLIDQPESDFHGKQHMIKTAPISMSANERSSLVTQHINILAPKFDLNSSTMDLGVLLNRPAYLTVVHNEAKDKDRTYANIGNTMSVPEGMEVGELDTTPFYFDFDNPDLDVWTKYLSDYIKEKIQSALNYKGSAVEDMVMRLEAMSGTNSETSE